MKMNTTISTRDERAASHEGSSIETDVRRKMSDISAEELHPALDSAAADNDREQSEDNSGRIAIPDPRHRSGRDPTDEVPSRRIKEELFDARVTAEDQIGKSRALQTAP